MFRPSSHLLWLVVSKVLYTKHNSFYLGIFFHYERVGCEIQYVTIHRLLFYVSLLILLNSGFVSFGHFEPGRAHQGGPGGPWPPLIFGGKDS